MVAVKARACARPAELDLPQARLSNAETARVALALGIVEAISTTTIWHRLVEDAFRSWRQRSLIFPRDPDFEAKLKSNPDLYAGRFEGRPLRAHEHVVCDGEKTSIQARPGIHAGTPHGPGRAGRVEHELWKRPPREAKGLEVSVESCAASARRGGPATSSPSVFDPSPSLTVRRGRSYI